MNSKKNKKNIVAEEQDNHVVKKSKKKKLEPTNENFDSENKPKKRKNQDSEPDIIPSKKGKKKHNALENVSESTLPNDNLELLESQKIQNNGHISSDGLEEDNVVLGEVSKKGKKKKKIKLEMEDETENDLVSFSKSPKGTNLLTVEGLDDTVINSKKILHHEVNIVDIKGEIVCEDNENVVTISIKDEAMDSDWDENELLKQLEKKIEKKDVSKERRAGIEWPDEDLHELISRMESDLPENDIKPYMKRVDTIEWDKIAFKNYTSEDCKKTWSLILKKIRRYRILKEVLQDAKEWISIPRIKKKATKNRHPDMPRRPLSAYFIYYLKKKVSLQAEHPGLDATELAKMCSQKFKTLSPEKKLKYEKLANKNKEEYEQKLKEFYENHPECKVEKELKSKKAPKPIVEKPPKVKVPKRPLSAFQYFHLAEASKEQVEDKASFKELCKERWKQMPDDKKIEWISYAEAETIKYEEELKEYIKNHPDYVHTYHNKPQLTKEEQLVKERLSGKPPKPPVSAYNLFARLLLHSEDIKNVPVKERLVFVSNQWKECTEEEKKGYKELFDKEIEKHNKEYAAYLESLPEEERKVELEKAAQKKRKPPEKSDDVKVKKESTKKVAKKVNTDKKKSVKSKANSASKKKPRKLVEPEQPPISPFKYFASLYKGEEPVRKAWKELTEEQKKVYEEELVQKKRAYILDFEKFLKSMTKEELENFSNSRKKQNNQQSSEEDDDEDESSEQSDSEDEDEEESGEEHD